MITTLDAYGRPESLNMAGAYPRSSALGPGHRFLIWTQGCLNRCPGCVAPTMQPLADRQWVEVRRLARAIGGTDGICGVTVVGGEPLLQIRSVTGLFKILHEEYDLGTMLYTGYYLDDLMLFDPVLFSALLRHTDLLVDGPYVRERDRSQKWRGSENQTIHFTSSRYEGYGDVVHERQREVEIHVGDRGDYLVLGIPPQGLAESWHGLDRED